MKQVIWIFAFIFFTTYAYGSEKGVDGYCQFNLLQAKTDISPTVLKPTQKIDLALPQGFSRVSVTCETSVQHILSFQRFELLSFEFDALQKSDTEILVAQPSYLIPIGSFQGEINFESRRSVDPQFRMFLVSNYIAQNQESTLIIGAFYGLCVTLILYILIMGSSLGRQPFQLYSLYVTCASTFYLLQEGHMNLFLPHTTFFNHHNTHLMMAGMTYVTFVVYVVKLLELDKHFQKVTRFSLFYPASLVTLIPFITLFIEDMSVVYILSQTMSVIAVVTALIVFFLSGLAAYRRVHTAMLVFGSLSLMILAILLRFWLLDVDAFLNRYAMLIAFSFESFVLAIATSERIKQINKELLLAEQEAISDQLCDILNRRGWEKRANLILEQHRQKGGFLCMLYIDINHFKQINDQYGHGVGDDVLKIISKILVNQIREIDAAGRLGGDEFVALALFNSRQKCVQMTNRLSKRLEKLKIRTQSVTLEISASVGNVTFEETPEDVSEMLNLGDRSMYRVKRSYYHLTSEST